MTTATGVDFVSEIIAPIDPAGVADAVRAAHDARRPLYPFGGRTALDYGIAPTRPGMGLDLTELAKIVDYTPRDMTILVEAGVRMAELAATLAAEGQQLPIDVPRAADATLGGVVATNWNGPRRYGHGTIRDYVIGIHAVDGRGVLFKGGGRVVKNVAGYDFCKLLCGSLGTLGVITQLALKVKPQPEQVAAVVAQCLDLSAAETMLSRVTQLDAPPAAVDLLVGADWNAAPVIRNPKSALRNPNAWLVLRLEGTEREVAWLAERVQNELRAAGGTAVRRLDPREADALWARQIEFADRPTWARLSETRNAPAERGDHVDDSPMALKIAVPPSAVRQIIGELLQFDADAAIQAHAGNGIIYVRFRQFNHGDLTGILIGKLRPAAVKLGGSLVVIASRLEGLTPHMVWGGRTEASLPAERIKLKFDPRNILNPGRTVF